ncbi:uncharacterized protein [Dysidea avara]|uniref:uncharacterized protein n=1 Tax=Dysidea avara TaxID=196820 RepID=UPI0033249BD8
MFGYCYSFLLLVVVVNSAILEKDDPLLGIAQEYAGKSCAHIYDNNFASRNKSGLYWVKLTTNEIVQVHCEMGLSVGSSKTTAWTKIADVDGYSCPSGWEASTIPRSAKRVCKGNGEIAGCYSAHFRIRGQNFNEVYGKVLGYQKGTTTAFNAYYSKKHDIDDTYVDGVSITYGYPRQHLFTYASGYSAGTYRYTYYNCPCSSYAGQTPPAFVRDNYYCEAGCPAAPSATTYYTDNMLWDGKDCPVGNSCCAQPEMPYFYRRLPIATNGTVEAIEVRICQDTSFATAGTLISEMQIFIGSDL